MSKLKDMWDKLSNREKESVVDAVSGGAPIEWSILVERIFSVVGFIIGCIVVFFLVTGAINQCSGVSLTKCLAHNNINNLEYTYYPGTNNITLYCKKCETKYYPSFKIIEYEVVKEPTCQEKGQFQGKFEDKENGHIFTLTGEIQTTNHEMGVIIEEEIPSTCITKGRTAIGECKWCSIELGGSYFGPSSCYYETVERVEPTCLEDGLSEYKYCIGCGEKESEPVVLEKVPCSLTSSYVIEKSYSSQHALIGTCIWCDSIDVIEVYEYALSEEYFTFKVDYNKKEATIVSFKDNVKEVIVPSEFNGIPIKKIADNAFEGSKNLETVTFEEGIEEIGKNCFSNCSSLKNITFPSSLKSINYRAFYNCNEIRRIYTHDAKIKEEAFASCYNLRIVEQSNVGEYISNNAFYNCPKLIFFKFGSLAPSNKIDVFNSNHALGETTHNYCPLFSGTGTESPYIQGTSADNVITLNDGFYYYKNNGEYTLLSIDKKGNIVIPSFIMYIDGDAFISNEGDICSVFVPKLVRSISSSKKICNNIVFYFERENLFDDRHQLTGTSTNPITNETVNYECIGYEYSETYKEGNYWYYDENGNIAIY